MSKAFLKQLKTLPISQTQTSFLPSLQKSPSPPPCVSKPLFSFPNAKWESDLWLECVRPSTWEALHAFSLQHVDRMEMLDRGIKSKSDDLLHNVMQRLDTTVESWKQGTLKQATALIGACNTGKTTMLKLLAAKHNFEFVAIHEDDPDELKMFLRNSADVGLENTERLWVIEHFDMFDTQSRAALKSAIPKLLKSGPVFVTAWPSADLRTLEFATKVSVLQMCTSAKLAFLDKFGKETFVESFAEGAGDVAITASVEQLRGKAMTTSLKLCESAMCSGGCDVCMARRRVPSNLRLLVEDTMCKRFTQRKCQMLAETDVELSTMLVQEMVPMVSQSLQSSLQALDALCVCDATAGFETFVKDAFVGGSVQSLVRTQNLGFSSGMLLPIPSALFAKHRASEDTQQKLQARVLDSRRQQMQKERKPKRKKEKEKGNLIVLENDSMDERVEIAMEWDDPRADLRRMLVQDVSLFESASVR